MEGWRAGQGETGRLRETTQAWHCHAVPLLFPVEGSAPREGTLQIPAERDQLGCASMGVEVGFERHSKDWPACRSNENILLPPLTRVAGGWHDVLELAMRGS